jgi:Tol biopolymer transport system component
MQAEPSSAERQAPSIRRASWVALGFGVWLIGAFFLVLWAIAQGLSPDVAASPFHIPVYAGLVTLAAFAAAAVIRAVRRGDGWRAALPRHPATIVGAAVLVGGLVLDVGWREGVGIGQGIEANLAPSRIVLAVGFLLVAAAPLLAARGHGGQAVPLLAIIGSAGLSMGLLSWPGGFHPAATAWMANGPDEPGQSAELWVMDGDGSHQTRLIEAAPGESLGYAGWTTDGSRITYTRFVLAEDEHLESGQAAIWSSAPDGTDRHADLRGSDWNWIPRWSPDGAWLAFTREAPGGPWMQGGPAGPAPGGGPQGAEGPLSVPLPQADIWRVAASGGEPERLTDSAGDDRAPVFSPDGTKILFDSTRDGNTEIYVMNADGTGQRRLTDDPGEDWGASWSPDGRQISFNSSRGGGDMDIYVMAADGSDVRRITFGESANVAPSWSPDGRQLAYTARDFQGNGQIMVVQATGGTPRSLSRAATFADELWTGGWGPDGRIVFDRITNPSTDTTGIIHENLAAAALLITAALVAVVLVLLAGMGLPFGSLTAACLIGFALASAPAQEWRFVPVGLGVGLVADILAWRAGTAWRSRLVGAAVGAGVVVGSGLVVLLTAGLAWSPTLLIGVATAGAGAGWVIGALGMPRPPAAPADG